jgi:hypothetical protein
MLGEAAAARWGEEEEDIDVQVAMIATDVPADDKAQNNSNRIGALNDAIEAVETRGGGDGEVLDVYAYNADTGEKERGIGRSRPITGNSIAKNTRSGGNRGRNAGMSDSDNKLLFVYPFVADDKELNQAASDLKELGGDLLGVVEYQGSKGMRNTSWESGETIKLDDMNSLPPSGRKCINDSLVNFWMLW